jgi:hypothetical protein
MTPITAAVAGETLTFALSDAFMAALPYLLNNGPGRWCTLVEAAGNRQIAVGEAEVQAVLIGGLCGAGMPLDQARHVSFRVYHNSLNCDAALTAARVLRAGLAAQP